MKSSKKLMILTLSIVFIVLSVSPAFAAGAKLAENMTAKEVSEMITKDPKIIVLDVRTQPEFQFVGYIKGAYNIPYWFFGKKFAVKDKDYEFAPGVIKKAPMNRYQFTQNPDFMKYVKKLTKPDDTVVVYCGSGVRSAKAADDMVKAGYKDVINMLSGIGGKDGWDKSKLPLDYMMKIKNLDPKFVYPPDRK